MLCQICKKNTAVLFVNRLEDGKNKQIAMCLPCAQKHGFNFQNMIQQSGMSPEDMKNLGEQMNEIMENLSENGDPDALEQMMPPDFMKMFMGTSPSEEDRDEAPEDMEGSEEEAEAAPGDRVRTRQKKVKQDTLKNLRKFSTDLTQKARDGKIDTVIGRTAEIERLIQILNRRTKNNPVLLGEPGVGKTAIAEGFALRIAKGELPPKFLQKKVFLLDMTGLVAGTQFRGQFEARMKAIINEVIQDGNVILVIDEIHNLVGAGDAQNAMNAANILKPALASGQIQIIGTTTLEEYRKYIEKDAALERRFQPITVDEPSTVETVEIIKGLRPHYEAYHNVFISDEIVEDAVYLSQRYIHQRFLPDKAIDVIDEASSRVNLKNTGLLELEKLNEQMNEILQRKEDAASRDDFETAAKCRVEELRLEKEIKATKDACLHVPLTFDDLAQVIEGWTKIPVKRLTHEEAEKLVSLEEHLHQRVIGQDQAVSALSRAIRRNRSGFRKEKKPASFIFAGPTGVGKTELVKTLAVELFGTEDALIRIDMSEYMEKHAVSKLIGAPPGYVGYDQGGQITEKVRRRPFSVILLDEIEKAHADVFNMLLQILDDGRLTDSQGRTVHFENTIIVMTTNAGVSFRHNGLGFIQATDDTEASVRTENALKELFRPEFLNRVDEIITFTSLSRPQLRQIVDLMLQDVYQAGERQNIRIEVGDDVKEYLVENGYDPKYGARPLRRLIQRTLEDEIAEAFLKGTVASGDEVRVTMLDGKPAILNLRRA